MAKTSSLITGVATLAMEEPRGMGATQVSLARRACQRLPAAGQE
jgi:hypothetical protein